MDTLPNSDRNNQNIPANGNDSDNNVASVPDVASGASASAAGAPAASSSKKWLIGVVAAVVIIGGGASAFLFGGGMFKGNVLDPNPSGGSLGSGQQNSFQQSSQFSAASQAQYQATQNPPSNSALSDDVSIPVGDIISSTTSAPSIKLTAGMSKSDAMAPKAVNLRWVFADANSTNEDNAAIAIFNTETFAKVKSYALYRFVGKVDVLPSDLSGAEKFGPDPAKASEKYAYDDISFVGDEQYSYFLQATLDDGTTITSKSVQILTDKRNIVLEGDIVSQTVSLTWRENNKIDSSQYSYLVRRATREDLTDIKTLQKFPEASSEKKFTYVDKTVKPDGDYYYVVQRIRDSKNPPINKSSVLRLKIPAKKIDTPAAKVAATPVVSATLDVAAKKITVTWTDASDKGLVTLYKVFSGSSADFDLKGGAGVPSEGAVITADKLTVVDTANIDVLLGTGGATRYYAVVSYKKGGDQLAVGYSAGVKIEVPDANLKPNIKLTPAYDQSKQSVVVRWSFYDKVEDDQYSFATAAKVSAYTLTKTVDGKSETITVPVKTPVSNDSFVYYDNSVSAGKTYGYLLQATLTNNFVAKSTLNSVDVTASDVKIGLTAALNSSDKSSVNFNWTVTGSDANIKGYALERSEDKEFGGAGGAVVTRVYPTVVTEFVKDSAATSGGTIIGGITQGKTFYYRFRGYGADNKVIVWSESLEFYVPVTAQSVNLSGFEIKTVGGAASGAGGGSATPKYIIVKYTLNGTFAGDVLTSSLHINGADVGVAEFKEKIKQANGSYAYEAILLPYELKGGDTISIKVMGPDGKKYTLGALNYGTKAVANNGGGVDETPPPDLAWDDLQAPPAVNMGLLIQTSSLPSGSVGSAYSATLSAAGGAIPYKWSVIDGSLPAGLGLNANGTLTGTPTVSGGWTFTLRASDSSSPAKNATRQFAIAIGAAGQTPPPAQNVTNVYNTYNTTSGGSSGGIVYVPTVPQQLGSAPTPGSDFTFTFDTTFAAVFKDIGNHWARDYISTLFNAKIVQGFTPISFAPDKEVTRAQLLKIVLESLKYNTAVAVGTNPCKDVIKGSWYARYFALAKTSGVITGYPDGTCKPNSSASRAEAVKILFTAVSKMPFSVKTKLPVAIPANYQNTYKDVSAGQWYYPYVVSSTQLGILKGYSNGTMRPNGKVTRAEMAKIMVMTLVKLVSK